MTIPNVTMRWCRKPAKCKWCEQTVEISSPIVAVVFWNRGNADNRSWNTYNYYHPQCWVSQGLDYLKRNPYVPHRRGRVSTLSKEDQRQRFLLVRRFHSIEQRMKNITADYPDSVLVESKLTKQMVDVMMEVAMLGEVPKSWLERLM